MDRQLTDEEIKQNLTEVRQYGQEKMDSIQLPNKDRKAIKRDLLFLERWSSHIEELQTLIAEEQKSQRPGNVSDRSKIVSLKKRLYSTRMMLKKLLGGSSSEEFKEEAAKDLKTLHEYAIGSLLFRTSTKRLKKYNK